MISYTRAVYEVARKEALQHLRTKRLLIMGLLMLASLIFATLIVPLAIFNFNSPPSPGEQPYQNLAFLIFLNLPVIGGFLIIQMLSLILTADGVSSEWSRKTLFLLLSKPVPRSAFVLGKYIGSALPLLVLFLFIFMLDYMILLGALPGGVTAADFGRFMGALGLILLGTAAFCSMGLFFSTLSKSTTPSFITSLIAALLVFPIVGNIGTFMLFADEEEYYNSGEYDQCWDDLQESGELDRNDEAWLLCELDENKAKYDWSRYLTPGSSMNRASAVLDETGEVGIALSGFIPQLPPKHTWLAVLSTLGYTAAFLGASLALVRSRNFE